MQNDGVIAVITSSGRVEFVTEEPFTIGALIDASRTIEAVIRGQRIVPQKPEQLPEAIEVDE